MAAMTSELQAKINELVLNGDAASVLWIVDRQVSINTALELENAALWSFVRADDAMNDCVDPDHEWRDCDEAGNELLATREALRQYEAQS